MRHVLNAVGAMVLLLGSGAVALAATTDMTTSTTPVQRPALTTNGPYADGSPPPLGEHVGPTGSLMRDAANPKGETNGGSTGSGGGNTH